jgi:steroid delta-isomerase
MSPEVISKVVKAYFAATREMNEAAWLNTFAEDAISYDPVGGPEMVGYQKLGEFFQSIVNAFSEVGLTENQVFIAANQAAVKWTGAGISKQGNKVRFEGMTFSPSTRRARYKRYMLTGTLLRWSPSFSVERELEYI